MSQIYKLSELIDMANKGGKFYAYDNFGCGYSDSFFLMGSFNTNNVMTDWRLELDEKRTKLDQKPIEDIINNFHEALEAKYMRTGVTILLEPELFERLSFEIKPSVRREDHLNYEKQLACYTSVGTVYIRKDMR